MGDRNLHIKLHIIVLVALASATFQDGARSARSKDHLSRQTHNDIYSARSHGNATRDYIPRTVKNQTLHKPVFNIEGGFVTFPIAPPPASATHPKVPKVDTNAKSKGSRSTKRRRTKKPASNSPSNITQDGHVEESSKTQRNKRKGHKRRRARARAHQDSAVLQRDAPVNSNSQPNITSHLNAGAAVLGTFNDPAAPPPHVHEGDDSECVECPVRHIIVAPRAMACAPMVLPPVRTCRKKGHRGHARRVPIEMPSRLRMYPEGSHNVVIRLRTLSGRWRTCLLELVVQVRKCPPLPRAPDNGHHLCDMGNIWGSHCLSECQHNFATVGETLTTCEEVEGSMRWTKPPPRCLAKLPPVPKPGNCIDQTVDLQNGRTVAKKPEFAKANGEAAEVHCTLDGLSLKVGVHENICEATDDQLNIGATCTYRVHVKVRGCFNPRTVANGAIDCDTPRQHDAFPVGAKCWYACKEGFVIPKTFQGSIHTECLPSLSWSTSNPPPECHRKIPPEALPNTCQDTSYVVQDLDEFEVPVPGFTTASGQVARVSCSLKRIASYGEFDNNCTASDDQLGVSATCIYKVTVKGIQCPPLGSLINGQMNCYNLAGNYRCDVTCNKGYRLPSSYKFLERGYIECDDDGGGWDFQKQSPATRLPDCLGELPSTSLSSRLTFNVSVPSCSDSRSIEHLSEYVKETLLQTNKDTCQDVTCDAVTRVCTRNVLVTTWTVMATYTPPEKDYDYAVPEAEELIEKLHMDTQNLIHQDAKFFSALSGRFGAELLGETLHISHIDLICGRDGYAVDPSSYRCVECPTGYYQKGNDCTLCPSDTYQDRTGQTQCVDCPAGTESTSGAHSRESCRVTDSTVK